MEKAWVRDLRYRVRRFVKDHPGLTTETWARAATRAWLDALPMGKQSKANMRNAVHRFGGWLVERGYFAENPAGGIRITGRLTGAKLADRPPPPIFTPRQAEALLRACELGSCRRLLGWMASCLTTGIRPESEAPRATWPEVRLDAAEWHVMGRKRGVKPRVIPMQPAAVAWMRIVAADKMERPAVYSKRLKARAVQLANEWLAERHPDEKPVIWSEDICRHTFASYRAPQITVDKLAEEMGTSTKMIYAHYRNPRPAASVKAYWALRPANRL